MLKGIVEVLLICSILLILAIVVGKINYRKGQIEALTGNQKYYLISLPDSTRYWKKIDAESQLQKNIDSLRWQGVTFPNHSVTNMSYCPEYVHKFRYARPLTLEDTIKLRAGVVIDTQSFQVTGLHTILMLTDTSITRR